MNPTFSRKTMSRQNRLLLLWLVFCNKSNEILPFLQFINLEFSYKFHQNVMFCNKSNEILPFLPPWLCPLPPWAPSWDVVFCNRPNEIMPFSHFDACAQFEHHFMFCNKYDGILLFLLSRTTFFWSWISVGCRVLQQVKRNIAFFTS